MIRQTFYIFSIVAVLCACTDPNLNTTPSEKNKSAISTKMAPNERLAIQHLIWLDNADPEADAQKAIKANRLVLYTLGERGVNYPGISADQQQRLIKRCKTKVLSGATDTIQGKIHLTYI